MKQLIAFFLLLPVLSFAQECKIKRDVDPFTKETKLTTGLMPINSGINRVLLSIDATSTEVDFFLTLNDGQEGKCFDDASTATIIFEGNRLKANYKNTGSMNCDGLFHFTFRNVTVTPSALQNLANKKVITIQLTGNNKTVTNINLREQDQKLFADAVVCMIKESKSITKK